MWICYTNYSEREVITMKVKITGDKSYPLEIDNTYEKFHIHRFILEDDEKWEDFIDKLNFYRECYVSDKVANLLKNLQKKS